MNTAFMIDPLTPDNNTKLIDWLEEYGKDSTIMLRDIDKLTYRDLTTQEIVTHITEQAISNDPIEVKGLIRIACITSEDNEYALSCTSGINGKEVFLFTVSIC